MRCPLASLLLVALSAGCAPRAARAAAPLWTAAAPPPPAAVPAPEPRAWTPRTSPPAAPRTNLMAAPAPSVPATGGATGKQPTAAPDTPSVKPPAEDIAALKRMLRRAPAPPIARRSSARIPDGSACLEMLDRFHLPYSRLAHVEGIKTPISVKVPIGGIRYHSWGTRPLVADCRFVVALEWIAPVLKQIGVTEVRYIGTYAYRMARVGRLSLHAYGLAIDISGMVVGGTTYTVSKAFTRGMGRAGCSPAAPVLDEVACRVKEMGLFREVLTPDSNADHQNHFHFGILPTGMTLAMLPRYLPGHRRHRHHHRHASHETKLADRTAPKDDDAPRARDKLARTDGEPGATDARRAVESARRHKGPARHGRRVARNDHDKHPVARDAARRGKRIARSGRHADERTARNSRHTDARAAKHERHTDARAAKHERHTDARAAKHERHTDKRLAGSGRRTHGHHPRSSAVARADRHAVEHARHSTSAQADKRKLARTRTHSARYHPGTGERATHLAKRNRHSGKSRRHAATGAHHDKRVAARAKPHPERHDDAEREHAVHHRTAERRRHHGRSRESGR